MSLFAARRFAKKDACRIFCFRHVVELELGGREVVNRVRWGTKQP